MLIHKESRKDGLMLFIAPESFDKTHTNVVNLTLDKYCWIQFGIFSTFTDSQEPECGALVDSINSKTWKHNTEWQ